jgi:FkbM family methyltransferase
MTEALDYEFLYNKRGGFFETVITALYRGVVQEGDAVLDGGAHIGAHTGPLAGCVGKSGKVIAVEALPHLAENLRKKFPVAKFPNVEIQSCAISSTRGTTSFNWVTNNEGYSGIRPRTYPSGCEIQSITVPVTTIDDLLANEQKEISFIKLDLEGGEFCALLGAKNVILKDRPVIAFENGLEWTRRF